MDHIRKLQKYLTTADNALVLRALKELECANITVDVLKETGIGKTVNSLRHNEEFGERCRSLVGKWRALAEIALTKQTEEAGDDDDEEEEEEEEEQQETDDAAGDCDASQSDPGSAFGSEASSPKSDLSDFTPKLSLPANNHASSRVSSNLPVAKPSNAQPSLHSPSAYIPAAAKMNGDLHSVAKVERSAPAKPVSSSLLNGLASKPVYAPRMPTATTKNDLCNGQHCDQRQAPSQKAALDRPVHNPSNHTSGGHFERLLSAGLDKQRPTSSSVPRVSSQPQELKAASLAYQQGQPKSSGVLNGLAVGKSASAGSSPNDGSLERYKSYKVIKKSPTSQSERGSPYPSQAFASSATGGSTKVVNGGGWMKLSVSDASAPIRMSDFLPKVEPNFLLDEDTKKPSSNQLSARSGKPQFIAKLPANDLNRFYKPLPKVAPPPPTDSCVKPEFPFDLRLDDDESDSDSEDYATDGRKAGSKTSSSTTMTTSSDDWMDDACSKKRTYVQLYTGKKSKTVGAVPGLKSECYKVLANNIRVLQRSLIYYSEEVGDYIGVPFSLLEQILEKAKAEELFIIEDYNPYLMPDTDKYWKGHFQRDFKASSLKKGESETWKELYLRAKQEREAHLQKLAEKMKQHTKVLEKEKPRTKLAFVDVVAKPPRNVRRAQIKNGTGKTQIATAEDVLSHRRRIDESIGANRDVQVKKRLAIEFTDMETVLPKKIKTIAPMMAKSLKMMKSAKCR